MGFSDFLEGLLKKEATGRRVRKQTMMTRLAGFPAAKTLDNFSYDFAEGVKKSQVQELAGLNFAERRENVVLLGPSVESPRVSWRPVGLSQTDMTA